MITMQMSPTLVFVWCILASSVPAQILDPELKGTWTTKSGKVLTGPSFWDPLNERFFEPNLTGISYSFTADGFYEEAYFRAISNPTNPACPSAILQWQHGRVRETDSGSLVLHPFKLDGRQLLSEPCKSASSILTRYNQSELLSKYEVVTDAYNGRQRLNLFGWDGTPLNPMWLAERPPVMLPTRPLSTKNVHNGSRQRVKRGIHKHALGRAVALVDTSRVFWIGLGLTSVGSVLFICF